MSLRLLSVLILLAAACVHSQSVSKVWVADNGDGTGEPVSRYKKPNVGDPFKAREGRWIGAKIGFFFTRGAKFNDAGSVDIDWIRFEK